MKFIGILHDCLVYFNERSYQKTKGAFPPLSIQNALCTRLLGPIEVFGLQIAEKRKKLITNK